MIFESQRTRDNRLIEQWQSGDDSVIDTIYKQNFKKVTSYLIKRYGVSHSQAIDAYDEAIIVLVEKRTVFKLSSSLSTYLTAVARNKCVDELRIIWKKGDSDISGIDDEFSDQEDGHRSSPYPEELMTFNTFIAETDKKNEVIELVLNRIRKDKVICSDIFRLYYWEGLILEEVAKALGLSYGYVRQRVSYCENNFKTIMERINAREI